jgi:plasmid maintenance system antidote protein VapI
MTNARSSSSPDAVIEILREKLTRGQVRNRRYSLRALARDIGLSPSHLSEVLNGRHRISAKTAGQILRTLQSKIEQDPENKP